MDFICSTLFLLAIALFVGLYMKRREGFAGSDTGSAASTSAPTAPTEPSAASAPESAPTQQISITELSEIHGAIPAELNGTIQPSPVDSSPSEIPAEEDKLSPRKLRAKKTKTPSLNQGTEHNKSVAKNACESPEYIRKDRIPCWACTLPTTTD